MTRSSTETHSSEIPQQPNKKRRGKNVKRGYASKDSKQDDECPEVLKDSKEDFKKGSKKDSKSLKVSCESLKVSDGADTVKVSRSAGEDTKKGDDDTI